MISITYNCNSEFCRLDCTVRTGLIIVAPTGAVMPTVVTPGPETSLTRPRRVGGLERERKRETEL